MELEARRHTPEGRVAVAGVLIWAHPAVPDRGRSLAELFRERTEVGLTVYPPNTAPDSADVFDYEEPTTAGTAAPLQRAPGAAGAGHGQGAGLRAREPAVTWLVLLVLALGLSVTARPLERLALLAALVWLAVRAPVGPALGLQPLFSPATFFRPVLGPLSGSAGVLALAGLLLTVGGVWLWRQRLAAALVRPRRSAARCCCSRPTSSAASAAASPRRRTACRSVSG